MPKADFSHKESAKRSARDLKQDLIEAGLQILAEDGLESLTLRKVAARAGVSHAAPAHHFQGLPHLLGCISAVGFDWLTEEMKVRRTEAEPNARARLVAICEGYVIFSEKNPSLMQLMFNTRRGGRIDDSHLKAAARGAYQVLREACAPFEPVGSEPDSTETLIWSIVHGFAMLNIGGRFGNPNRLTTAPELRDIVPALALKT